MTQEEFIKYTERMNKNIVSLLKGNEEELAFKDRKILANLNAVDLLNIIEFLQDDSRQCLEELSKLKEEITNLSKDVDMWNAKYNDMFDENRMLKKQVEERPKEYVFIGNAQNKTRDFINQITKDNKEFKTQQKEFISYLENEIYSIELKGTCINYNC